MILYIHGVRDAPYQEGTPWGMQTMHTVSNVSKGNAMTIIAIILTAVITAVVTYKVTMSRIRPTAMVVATPPAPKRLIVRFGKPMAHTNVVARADWLVRTVRMSLSTAHPHHHIFVETSLVQPELVVVEGDVTPLQASKIISWITQFVYPR